MSNASYEEVQKIRELNAEIDALRKETEALRHAKAEAETRAERAVAEAAAARARVKLVEGKFSGQEREVARLQTELAKLRQAIKRGE